MAMFVALIRISSRRAEKTTKRLIELRDTNTGPTEYDGRITEEIFDMKHQDAALGPL